MRFDGIGSDPWRRFSNVGIIVVVQCEGPLNRSAMPNNFFYMLQNCRRSAAIGITLVDSGPQVLLHRQVWPFWASYSHIARIHSWRLVNRKHMLETFILSHRSTSTLLERNNWDDLSQRPRPSSQIGFGHKNHITDLQASGFLTPLAASR